MRMLRRRLTFFNELPSSQLVALFADGKVADFLVAGGYALAMGMIDLTDDRARIVRDLEERGVPVTAWLLLPFEQGYWLNADNAELAISRYRETIAWATSANLQLHRIGLDIEFPHADSVALLQRPGPTLWRLLRQRRARGVVAAAERRYGELVDEIRAGGRSVETYQFPFIVDERRTGSSLLRRVFGILDISADVEVLMLYDTYLGESLSRSYFGEADGIALGVTGGGVNAKDPRERRRLLTWERLARQWLAAGSCSEFLYVFSLEGCVWNHLLPRFAELDARCPIPATIAPTGPGRRRRALLRAILRCERLVDFLLR